MTGSAHQALNRALTQLAAAGKRPPCGDFPVDSPWLSEDSAERRTAAKWCDGCPVLAACHAAAEEDPPTFGVWAGVDYGLRGRQVAGSEVPR